MALVRPYILPAPLSHLSPSEHERYRTSHHEARHAASAASVGFRILTVDLMQPMTAFAAPLSLESLPECWESNYTEVYKSVTKIIGVGLAPYMGTLGAMNEGDATHLRLWQHAWERLPVRLGHPPAPWAGLVESARRQVSLWLQRPGAAEALDLLAFVLRENVRVDPGGWVSFWDWPDFAVLRGDRQESASLLSQTPTRPSSLAGLQAWTRR